MAQPYRNCIISAGLVEGIEPDRFYLRFEREGEDREPLTIFMRADEVAAVLFVCGGALWSAMMIERSPDPDVEKECPSP